jgi:protein arginine kinase
MKNWIEYESKEREKSIILSSRIRLARNLNGTPFPHKLNTNDGRNVINEIESKVDFSNELGNNFSKIHLWENNELGISSYLEKHLISSNLIKNEDKAALILSDDEIVSIMLNEEDHIRLQCISGGLNLKEIYDKANNIDDLIERKLDIAFDERLGYLTACPTNLGTALRGSVMMHLPALTMNDEITGMFKALTQVGMTIRGLYGEGSKALGNIYQISNQITLGITEDEILNNIEVVVKEFLEHELNTREQFIKNYKYELEDKIFRALGILQNCIVLSSKECLELLSYLRMGVELNLIKDISIPTLNKLLVSTQTQNNNINLNKISNREQDINRASLVRKFLKKE